MKKLLLQLLLFSSIAAQAQQPVLFQDRQRLTFVLRSSDGNSETRALFQVLAEGQNRPATSIELNISFDQLLRVVRSSRTQVTSSFEGKEFSVDGDVFYKGFDIRTALIPDELAAVTTLRVSGTDLSPVVSNITARIRNGETGRIEKQHADSSHQSWKLEASGHQLTFTKDALTVLRGRVTLVNEYFAAAAELDPLHARLQTVDPRDIEHMSLQQEKLVDIEAALARIDARDFENKLGLVSNDPLRFLPRMDALRAEVFSRRVALDETRRLLFLHLYNAGLDLQARGRKMEARRFFTNSIQENPLFAPAAYQLARMDFADGCLDDATSLGLDILERMQPDPDMRRLTVVLLQDIYDTYLEDAQRLNGQKKFQRSLEVLGKAQRLCRQSGSVRCDAGLEAGFRTAHACVYGGMLEEARIEVQQAVSTRRRTPSLKRCSTSKSMRLTLYPQQKPSPCFKASGRSATMSGSLWVRHT